MVLLQTQGELIFAMFVQPCRPLDGGVFFTTEVSYNSPVSTKSLIWIGVFIGSTVGSFIPMLWGGDLLGVSSILWSTIGGLAGIWGGFKLSKMI